ncbi:MAG: sigma-70 family RNA polymerase sigma factor [Flavobacteriales bacterium]|nr:sigma-70 family RNA polymerase sigma factor [Flavobacteriales bacterium]
MRGTSSDAADDDTVVARLRTGDRRALGTLWDRYAHLLYGVGIKYLKDAERAKDTVAELFAVLPELLRRHQVEHFRPWVHTVMRNRCLMVLRSERPGRSLDLERVDIPGHDEAGEALLREAGLQRLENAIAQLNADQRTCIEAFHLRRMSYAQVAALTGHDVEQVRSHLQNGRRNLRLILLRHADQNDR